MLTNQVDTSSSKKKWIIIGVITLIVIVAAVNIFVMQGKKKGASTTSDAVSFEKVTERKLNNTKLISGQVKPGNIESFYADPAKG
ncbi:efflux transporter periplasmic adaptor subunit, partial [Bacillus thuringiensis]